MNEGLNPKMLENRTVRVEYNDPGGKIACHRALLQVIEDDRWQLVFELSQLPIVNPGTRLILGAIDEERNREVHFKADVTDVFFGKATIFVSKPEQVDITKQRQYFRCQVQFPVQLDLGAKPIKATARDLSAGGMRVELEEESGIVNGRRLSCHFTLPGTAETQAVTIRGEVVRIERQEDKKIQIAIRFLVIHDKNRNDIIQYLFRCQREAMQARKRM